MNDVRPRIVLLADVRNWAFDFVARSISAHLSDRYRIQVAYSADCPALDPGSLDLLYVFFWGDRYHQRFNIPKSKVIREVASFRWQTEAQFGHLSPEQFSHEYLDDCLLVTTPAASLRTALLPARKDVFVCPNGFETALFYPKQPRSGPLRVGWVGRPTDGTKGLRDILLPATRGKCEFRHTDGGWSRARIAQFYREVDVIAIASIAESQPLPLIEGMASGCFPVACNVGIVPELVVDGVNGLVVVRSVATFQAAFEWCSKHLDFVRSAGRQNAFLMRRTRTWEACVGRFDEIFSYALAVQQEGAEPQSVPRPSGQPVPNGIHWPQPLTDKDGLDFGSSGKSLRVKKWRILLDDYRIWFFGSVRRLILLCSLRDLAKCALPKPWLQRLKRVRQIFLR